MVDFIWSGVNIGQSHRWFVSDLFTHFTPIIYLYIDTPDQILCIDGKKMHKNTFFC